ncbi:MAG TPA: hypothetical protein VIT23_05885 [Terrimicrobiaceae bacterium]
MKNRDELESNGFVFTEKKGHQWYPWNPTVELLLKAIVNPVPMYARKVEMLRIPEAGTPIGFDLVKSDWVSLLERATLPV